MQNIMKGKKGIVIGVANEFSIGWHIAKNIIEQGGEVCFFSHPRMADKFVKPLVEKEAPDSLVLACDVQDDEQMQAAFDKAKEVMPEIDFLVHSVAFAARDCFANRYIETKREDFLNSLDISCYSFTSACNMAEAMLKKGATCITMTYLGSSRVIPDYKVMGVAKAALEASVRYLALELGMSKGVRVNALSPGPLRTLAASGIKGFGGLLEKAAALTTLQRNISTDEAGKAGLYLLSDLSTGVTGEVHYVDAGAHAMAVPPKLEDNG